MGYLFAPSFCACLGSTGYELIDGLCFLGVCFCVGQVSSCSELGWTSTLRDTESDKDSKHICAASKAAPLNECSGLMDFRTAR